MTNAKIRISGIIAVAILLLVTLLVPITAHAVSNGSKPEEVSARVAERKLEAKTSLEEKRANSELKIQEKRKEACEKRVSKLSSSMDRISTQATRLLGVMDDFYAKVQGFYESGQLTVANYDELNANVETAKANAELEISALGELNTDIDCNNPDVSSTISAFKGSTNAAKDSLKEYRKSLVALISALKSESASQDAESDDTETEAEQETSTDESTTDEDETTETEGTN